MCPLIINRQPIEIQVDTGTDVSIISEDICQKYFPHLTLALTEVKLRAYSNEELQVMGKLFVTVEHNHQGLPLELLVVTGNGPSLLGCNWLQIIRLNWHHINHVQGHSPNSELSTLLLQRHSLFREGLGTIKRHKASQQINPEAPPKFFKARPVPFAIRDAVGVQLDKLEREKVANSSWAAPIVVVPKKDGSYRLCGDYKVTVNAAMDVDQYPLPKPEEIFTSLAGGQLFSATPSHGGIQGFHHHQYPSRPISVYSASIWYCICPSHFLKDCGFHTTRCSTSRLLH